MDPLSLSRRLSFHFNGFLNYHKAGQLWNWFMFKTYLRRSTHLNYSPVELTFYITSWCNLMCRFCTRKAPSKDHDYYNFSDMSLDSFAGLINFFSDALLVNISGGEPFLNEDCIRMIDYAYSRRIRISVSTNGVNIAEMVSEIVKSPLSSLNISLNSDDPYE